MLDRQDMPAAIRRSDYRPPTFTVDAIRLEFDLDPSETIVTAELSLRCLTETAFPVHLDGEDLTLLELSLDGAALDPARHVDGAGRLVLHDLPPRATLRTRCRIAPEANSRLTGLYLSNGIFCTQCEAQGFRRITFFPDRPDVLATYDVTIRADAGSCPVLLSNGNCMDRQSLPDGRHMARWQDPFPKPSYLFALVAGRLDRLADGFTTRSGRQVDLHLYVEPGQAARAQCAMAALKQSMAWDEARFGLEYDLDIFNIVAVADFNSGAMENKSLNIFNAKYILADEATATDTDMELIEGVVAHEYFHNWTGNRVTCRDWFQLSLKEGLTVFRDQEFTADHRSRAVKRIRDVRTLRARQFPEDAGPLAHPVRPDAYVEINNFYTATVYEKGAEVIRMIHTILGEARFQAGMRLYLERHDGQAATCEDFVAAMEEASGIDLVQFRRWYSQSGTPRVTAQWHVEGPASGAASAAGGQALPEGGCLVLTLSQDTPPTADQAGKEPLDIPIRLALLDGEGRPIAARLEDAEGAASDRPARTAHLLRLTAPRQRFRLRPVEAQENAPLPSLNCGFSAPVILQADYGDADDAFLMVRDPDAVNRWEAGQRYATRVLLRMAAAEDPAMAVDGRYVDAFGSLLRDEAMDPSFAAVAMVLPEEGYLADQMAVVDVDGLHAAREAMLRAIALAHRNVLLGMHARLQPARPYRADADQAALRAQRNAALALLGLLTEDAEVQRLVMAHYRDADNMTDRLAALTVLANHGQEAARNLALADFEERYRGEALVLDKWLAVQAQAPRRDALATVRRLLDHPAFRLSNPNRVYALIGAFAMRNQWRFHAADGGGYAFLAEQVKKLDGLNRQVAARMAGAFGRWRRYDGPRQNLMRAALESIRDMPGLSRDTFEIVNKSLEAGK